MRNGQDKEVYVGELTGELKAYNEYGNQIQTMPDDGNVESMLRMVREDFLVDESRFGAVLLITTKVDVSAAKNESNKLGSNKRVVLFYVISEMTDDAIISDLRDISGGEMANFKRNGGLANEFKISHIRGVKKRFDQSMCNNTQKQCFFTDQSQNRCAQGVWTPWVKSKYGNCSETVPPPKPGTGATCQNRESCTTVCDANWPWTSTPNCKTTCGNFGRQGPAEWKELETCPQLYECPGCTTIITTTTTTRTTSMWSTAKESSSEETAGWVIALIIVFSIIIVALIIVALLFAQKWYADARKVDRWKRFQEAEMIPSESSGGAADSPLSEKKPPMKEDSITISLDPYKKPPTTSSPKGTYRMLKKSAKR